VGYFEFKKLKSLDFSRFKTEEEKDIYWQNVAKYLNKLGEIFSS